MDDLIVPELQNVDTTLIIDPDTRTIDVGSDFLLGVETDNDAERVKFQCPKIVGDNLDLSQYHIYIHYQNAKGEKGKYLCEDIEDGGENITFSWLLSQKAVLYKGQTKFLVCAKKTQEDTIVWNTTLANGNVLEGLDVDEDIVQQNDDVIEQILLNLEQIEASGGTGDINNAKVTFTEAEERTNIKSQETMSTMFSKIKKWFTDLKTVAFSGSYNDLSNKPTIPTKTSQLDNDSQFSTFSGSYNDLSDKPTIPSEYTLPIAKPTTLGGVKPIAKTDEMTQEVGVDEAGGLFTKEGDGIDEETLNQINRNTEDISKLSEEKADKEHTHTDYATKEDLKNVSVSEEQIKSVVENYLEENPIEGGSSAYEPLPLLETVEITEETAYFTFNTNLDLTEFAILFTDCVATKDANFYVRLNNNSGYQNTFYGLILSDGTTGGNGYRLVRGKRVSVDAWKIDTNTNKMAFNVVPITLNSNVTSIYLHGQTLTSGKIRLYGR